MSKLSSVQTVSRFRSNRWVLFRPDGELRLIIMRQSEISDNYSVPYLGLWAILQLHFEHTFFHPIQFASPNALLFGSRRRRRRRRKNWLKCANHRKLRERKVFFFLQNQNPLQPQQYTYTSSIEYEQVLKWQ